MEEAHPRVDVSFLYAALEADESDPSEVVRSLVPTRDIEMFSLHLAAQRRGRRVRSQWMLETILFMLSLELTQR